jgi:hypothetical protein
MQEGDRSAVPICVQRKKMLLTGNSPSRDRRRQGLRRHLLSRISVRAEVRDGKNLFAAEDEVRFCSVFQVPRERTRGTGAVSFIPARRGRGRGSCRQSRRGASEEMVTLGINSESCNSRYHVARRLPRHATRRRRHTHARMARLYPFLNFSIWTDEVQPYKSNQCLVKFQSGTNIKCPTVIHRRVLLIY